MPGGYNAGSSPQRVVLVDPTTLDDYSAGGTGTGAQEVQGNAADNAVDTGNAVKVGGRVLSTLATTYADGDRAPLTQNSRGGLFVQLSDNTGLIGNFGSTAVDGVSAVNAAPLFLARNTIFNGTSFDRMRKPNLTSRLPSSAASVNATLVKNAAGDVVCINGYNASAGVIYLKLYNKATAPTVGTDTPAYTLALPPTATFSFNLQSQYFGTGIGYGLTTGAADADATAVGAGDILGLNIAYS